MEESFATRNRDGCPVDLRTKVFVGDESVVVVLLGCESEDISRKSRMCMVMAMIMIFEILSIFPLEYFRNR